MTVPAPVTRLLETPEWLDRGHVPALDGLRGIAILMVVVAHAFGTSGFPVTRGSMLWESVTPIGGVGVTVFFVLSGFLITLLLLREEDHTDSISIRAFYIRRVLRIVPAYMTYLLVAALFVAYGPPVFDRRDWFTAVTYTSSLMPPRTWELVHLWSLSIEEQFYLAWPLLVALAPRRAATWLATTCVGGVLAARVVVLVFVPSYAWCVDYFTFTRLDGIAIGCLLAIAARRAEFRRVTLASESRLAWAGVAAALLLPCWYVLSTPVVAREVLGALDLRLPPAAAFVIEVIKNTVVAGLVAIVVWSVANVPWRTMGRGLQWGPLVLLGVISYSLYLWQELFLNWSHDLAPFRWPVNVVCALAAASASYLCVERPFLTLKDRLAARSPRRMPAALIRQEAR